MIFRLSPIATFLVIFAVSDLVFAIPWPSASPTDPGSGDQGYSIRPTPPPVKYARYARAPIPQLFGRAAGSEKVCGSNVGEDGKTSALTCDDDVFTCYSDSKIGAIGCCRSSNAGYSQCRMHTRCVNEAEHCGDDCINDPLLKKCSSPTPSCATWRWQNGYSSFECDIVSFSADVLSAKEWVLPQKISATTSATSAASAVRTSGAATTSTTAPPPKASDQKKSNTIPIIAGVVVGVLLVLALILVLLARYKKKRKEAAQQQQQGPSELDATGGVMRGEFYKPDQKAGPISPMEEMPGDRRLMAAELTSSAEIVELPGDGRGSRTEMR